MALTIRASMLPAYPDCPRRAAAKQYRQLIESAGYQLRALLPSVGAAVGTAVHAAVAHVLRGKQSTGQPFPMSEGVAHALAAFRDEIKPGAEWDATTPNLQVAEFQIERLTAAYMPLVGGIHPKAVEAELRAQIADGWELTGHLDLLTEDGRIDDLKTGALKRPYQAQLGGYSLLARSNGYEVREVGTTFIPRGKKTKPQPPAEVTTYDLPTCEQAAFGTVQAIMRDVGQFRSTGDAYAFPANPMSLMCSRRYCPAHGTRFCTLHLPTAEEHFDGID